MKTCTYCGEDRKPSEFYFDNSLEGDKQICCHCLVDKLIEDGARQKVIDHISYCNDIELQEQKTLF